jgi:hypothetical protein
MLNRDRRRVSKREPYVMERPTVNGGTAIANFQQSCRLLGINRNREIIKPLGKANPASLRERLLTDPAREERLNANRALQTEQSPVLRGGEERGSDPLVSQITTNLLYVDTHACPARKDKQRQRP